MVTAVRFFDQARRQITKHFTVDHEKLVMTAIAVNEIRNNRKPMMGKYFIVDEEKLTHGRFDFKWLAYLGTEFGEAGKFLTKWDACIRKHGLDPNNPNGWEVALKSNKNAGKFWEDLHTVKLAWQKIGNDRNVTFFSKLKVNFTQAKKKMTDAAEKKVFGNEYFGAYALKYQVADAKFEDATLGGIQTASDRKEVNVGGLWKFVKKAKDTGKKIVESVVKPEPKAICGAIKEGLSALNQLGGLLAGLTDLLRGKEMDCRRLTARLGGEQWATKKWEEIKAKYTILEKLGARADTPGTFQDQFLAGYDTLVRSMEDFRLEIEEIEKKYGVALKWLAIWKADAKEIRADIARLDNDMTTLLSTAHFPKDQSYTGFVAEMKAEIPKQRAIYEKMVVKLETKIAEVETYLNAELDKVDRINKMLDGRDESTLTSQQKSKMRQMADAIAGHDTRADIIATKDLSLAAHGSATLNTDVAREAAAKALVWQARRAAAAARAQDEAGLVAQRAADAALAAEREVPPAPPVIADPDVRAILADADSPIPVAPVAPIVTLPATPTAPASTGRRGSVSAATSSASSVAPVVTAPPLPVDIIAEIMTAPPATVSETAPVEVPRIKKLINFWEGGAVGGHLSA